MNATHLLAACIILGSVSPVAAGVGAPTTLDCRATLENTPVRWEVELHGSLPIAVVDGVDAPADYAASHARVRLAASGPSLLIGRVTGRLVISDAAGLTLGSGQCTRLLSA